jgi:hypothetical protein
MPTPYALRWGEPRMTDLALLALTAGFFALAFALLAWIDRI